MLCGPLCRLNDAPVRGYEEDVGHKTTMRLFYPESASSNPGLNNIPETLMVMVPFKQQDLLWLKSIVNNEKRVCHQFLMYTRFSYPVCGYDKLQIRLNKTWI